MFATYEPVAHKWPLEKTSPALSKLPRPRMSNPYGLGSPPKPLWSEEGMYLPRTDANNSQQIFSTTQDTASDRSHAEATADAHRSSGHGHHFGDLQGYSQNFDQASSRFRTRTSPSAPSIMTEGSGYRETTGSAPFWRSRVDERAGLGVMSHHGMSSSAGAPTQAPFGQSSHGDGDDYSDDGDMVDGDPDNPQQTAAERLASRRKMKRFRLTHQQTRFLMSEFAKQPHPDAAHRDRLSREIPGLSPRQVQVWFQNRRAKIKRLNADDRERVVQMRAVPENFDNVQALHSPYGAVHPYDAPLSHAGGHSHPQIYGAQHPRPLMVDVRRSESENAIQSTGLTPVFGGISFGQGHVPGMMENSILSSPSTFGPNERYPYAPRPPTSAVTDTRTSSTNSPTTETDHRSVPRPLRPASVADSLARARSSSMQSSMGPSMYWRGGGLGDVAEVQDAAPEHGNQGQPPAIHSTSGTSGMGLNTLFYGGDATTTAQPSSATGDMASMQRDQLDRSRTASTSFPLDNRGQPYGEMSQQQQQAMHSPIRHDGSRPVASSGHGGPPYGDDGDGKTSGGGVEYPSPQPPFSDPMSLSHTRLPPPEVRGQTTNQLPQFGYGNTGGDDDGPGTVVQHSYSVGAQHQQQQHQQQQQQQTVMESSEQRPMLPPPPPYFQETGDVPVPAPFERSEALSYPENTEEAGGAKRE